LGQNDPTYSKFARLLLFVIQNFINKV